ncbi:MAG: metallophosphoesterase family protein [Thermoplasmatota archaeon]
METISFCREILGSNDSLEKLTKKDGKRVLEFLHYFEGEFNEFPLMDLKAPPGKGHILYIVGDLHGDLPAARAVLDNFHTIKEELILKKGSDWKVKLLFLGDYIDRAPEDVMNGGFLTLLLLLCAKWVHPADIFLLRGNHEAMDLLTFTPYELPAELDDIFGEANSEDIHQVLLSIFSRLPLFFRTSNGLIASHAGFPKNREAPISDMSKDDRNAILQTIWGDPVGSNTYRGDISRSSRFGREELEDFLEENNAGVLVRGHDHRTMGYQMYGGKLLTIHTSSRYRDRGAKGLQLVRALVHGKKRIRDVDDIKFLHLEDGKLRGATIKRFKD